MNEKKGNGFLIGFLVILVLGLIGFIAYDKIIATKETEKEIDNLKNQVNTLTEEKNNLINSQTQEETNTDNNNYINAVYYGFKEDAANNNYPKESLTLFSDGTFIDLFVDGGTNNGTYEIKDDKLILHTEQTAMSDGGDKTYEISQDQSQIKTTDGLTLQKR